MAANAADLGAEAVDARTVNVESFGVEGFGAEIFDAESFGAETHRHIEQKNNQRRSDSGGALAHRRSSRHVKADRRQRFAADADHS